jgi:hypothetical protein
MQLAYREVAAEVAPKWNSKKTAMQDKQIGFPRLHICIRLNTGSSSERQQQGRTAENLGAGSRFRGAASILLDTRLLHAVLQGGTG